MKENKENKELAAAARWLRPALEAFIFGDLVEIWPQKAAEAIRLTVDLDDEVYTDGAQIHLGLGRLRESENLVSDSYYMIGHELQHLHSTRQRDWLAGQVFVEKELFAALSENVLGHRIYPKRPKDVPAIVRALQEKGLFVSIPAIKNFAHYIVNVVEDGRIEAIRSQRNPGFRAQMVNYRTKMWEKTPVDCAGKDITAAEELQLVMSQYYFLATMGNWQKGFTLQFSQSSVGRNRVVYERCAALIPLVSKAILAKTCRECMKLCAEIAKVVSDLYCEVAKEQNVGDLLQRLLSALSEKENHSFGSRKDEEQGTGKPVESPFGTSVLVLPVDDETYEKLKKGSKDSQGDGTPNVLIVRQGGNSESEHEGQDSSTSIPAADTGETSTPPDDESASTGTPETDSSSSSHSGSEAPTESTSGSESASADGGSSGHGCSTDKSEADVESSIRNAQEEAQKRVDDLEESASRFRELAERLKRQPLDVESRAERPMSYNDIEKRYQAMSETTRLIVATRAYRPTEMLPYAVMRRGAAFKEELRRLAKAEELPERRCLRSGALDSSRVHRLAMKQYDSFKGKKQSQKRRKPAVEILIDNSSSMHGEKFRYAMEAAAIGEEGFKDLAALRVVTFLAESYDSVEHNVVKDWDERGLGNLSYNYTVHKGPRGGNKDGFSIRVATKELCERKEKEKLLLVLSDGMPSAYTGGEAKGIEDTIAAIREARAAGIVVVGIFFSESYSQKDADAFRRMYGEAAVVTAPDRVEAELTTILTEFFFR